ncbi:hypothetical protein OJAV_G00201630 [Oryzias javanicus]|uniref:Uncharacterized protein n=1 Tax=Oryzias javanicus TaxID=123683 RepID=A0A437C8W9_ORYJA|nr:hypothetical protein OJAV_G00201630 [Oryzias javanicus]
MICWRFRFPTNSIRMVPMLLSASEPPGVDVLAAITRTMLSWCRATVLPRYSARNTEPNPPEPTASTERSCSQWMTEEQHRGAAARRGGGAQRAAADTARRVGKQASGQQAAGGDRGRHGGVWPRGRYRSLLQT